MPARVRLVNWRWVRWSGGKWGKGEPQVVEGTVEAILDRPGGKWRIPEAPELEEEFSLPTHGWFGEDLPSYAPPEVLVNRMLQALLPAQHPHNPNRRIELVELFEEPDWKHSPPPQYDEEGRPIIY